MGPTGSTGPTGDTGVTVRQDRLATWDRPDQQVRLEIQERRDRQDRLATWDRPDQQVRQEIQE